MIEAKTQINEEEAINAVQVSDFSIEDAFYTDAMELHTSEKAETSICNNNEGSKYHNLTERQTKRKLGQVDADVMDNRLPKDSNELTSYPVSKEQDYQLRKKKWRKEKDWKKRGHLPNASTKRKFVINAQVWKSSAMISKLETKLGGYTAKSSRFENVHEIRSLEEAISLGFLLIKSEISHRPITDSSGRIVAVLAPPASDLSYIESTKQAFEKMKHEVAQANFSPKELFDHRRGDFHALNIGLSYGNGHTRPTHFNGGRYQKIADALLEDAHIQRLASYQDAIYALWHPRAYQYYKTNLDKLRETHPNLPSYLFPKSIMPSVAFNLGNRVVTKKHVDSQNCPFGWCTITALGNFDASKGGHIILWDLGIIAEFPPGACICLPSALITHSNISTGDEEDRVSFTQYCCGEIFRYIENGFRTDKRLEKEDSAILLFRKEARKTRVQNGYEMFSKIEELAKGSESKRMKF